MPRREPSGAGGCPGKGDASAGSRRPLAGTAAAFAMVNEAHRDYTAARLRSLIRSLRVPHNTTYSPTVLRGPRPVDHKFQINLRGIIDLLSNHLYSGPEVFVRELLQNGVDAIRARKHLEPDYRARSRSKSTPRAANRRPSSSPTTASA